MWRWWSAACWVACSVGCLLGCGGKSGLPQEQGVGASAGNGSGGSGGALSPGPLAAELREAEVDVDEGSGSQEPDDIDIYGQLVLDNQRGEHTRLVDVLEFSALFFKDGVEQLYLRQDFAGVISVPAGQSLVVPFEGHIETFEDSPFDLFCFADDDPSADVTLALEVIGQGGQSVTDTTEVSMHCD